MPCQDALLAAPHLARSLACRIIGSMPHNEKLSNRRPFKRVEEARVIRMLRENGAKTVADIGCGIGNTVQRLVEHGFDAIGLTVNPDEIATSGVGDRLILADIQQPLPDTLRQRLPLDAAVSLDCLEHLDNPLAGLRNINAMLRPGGVFIAYIPPEKWIECDYHVIVYTPRQMKWLFNLSGFEVQATQGRYRGKGVTYYAVKAGQGPLRPGTMK